MQPATMISQPLRPAGQAVRVLVVDDHPIVRRGLVETIADEDDLVVCGQACSGADAIALARSVRPDVAIVDLSLGDESGLDLVPALAGLQPPVRVLVLSSHDERLYADRALHAGALGYVMKDRSAGDLIAAIRRVASGKPYVSPETADRLLGMMSARSAAGPASPLERLSNRERHVLTLVGRGLSTREIAAQLSLSIKTVESHCAHIKEKLGLRHARDLTRAAVSLTGGGPG